MSTDTKENKLAKYPSTEKFKVIDTIGFPHPYCITSKHLEYCDSMYLDEHSIKRAESKGAKCDICKKNGNILSYDEHKQAVLIDVRDARELNDIPELKEYLLSIKDMLIADRFEGCAFKQVV